MSYEIEIIRKNQQITTTWAGGTTTQLAIYPKDAVYSERNFKWRISSAKVELEESLFTSLPGIWRYIMVLEGEMKLAHEKHHQAYLKPFEQDSFSGAWTTQSFGKVTDFNLMVAQGCEGKLQSIHLETQDCKKMNIKPLSSSGAHQATEAIYCVKGNVNVTIDDNTPINLEAGDLCILNSKNEESVIAITLSNGGVETADIVNSSVLY
ncbi:HutD family protein [Clostridiaceae bacterium 35-E11]